jgi:two-component system, response regulator YesN
MLKLLFADDELHIREYMKTVIDWNALGIILCECAKNAEEAIDIAEREKPDMVFLDINMPGMDGLTLTAALKEKFPYLVFAFITGYSEFEYARKALQLGAEDYILKPFSAEELQKAVLRLRMKIKKRIRERHESIEDQRILLENLLNRMIMVNDVYLNQKYLSRLQEMGIQFAFDMFLITQIELNYKDGARDEDNDLWKFCIQNIMEEYPVLSGITQFVLSGEDNKMLILMNGDAEALSEDLLSGYYSKIMTIVWDCLNTMVTIGVGEKVDKVELLSDSYQKAVVACSERYTQGTGKIFFYSKVKSQDRNSGFYRLDMNDRVLEVLRKKDKKKMKDIFQELYENTRKQKYSYDYSYIIFSGILATCLSYISDMNGSIAQILGEQFSPYQELQRKSSVKECVDWLEEIFEKTINEFQNTRSKRADEIIQSVENYIREHYFDYELTIEGIAEGVYLDASYIRRIFSKYMGCTISDYLSEMRLKVAGKLLEEGKMTVSQIAEKVGYSDPGYFAKCFKKYYGVTPTNYLSNIWRG